MDTFTHTEMLACRDRLLRDVTHVMNRRNINEDDLWIVNERRTIQQAAYHWSVRYSLDRRPSMYDIERLEPFAVGHIDYASKLCLYVAEFIYGQREIPA